MGNCFVCLLGSYVCNGKEGFGGDGGKGGLGMVGMVGMVWIDERFVCVCMRVGGGRRGGGGSGREKGEGWGEEGVESTNERI